MDAYANKPSSHFIAAQGLHLLMEKETMHHLQALYVSALRVYSREIRDRRAHMIRSPNMDRVALARLELELEEVTARLQELPSL